MKLVSVSSLFEVSYGVNLELNRMTVVPDGVPFVARSDRNNGVTARVKLLPSVQPIPAGTLSVAGGGSVLATFLQTEDYYSGRDLYYLTAKQPLTDAQKLYYAACIRANRYRYSYGRQANRTLKDLMVPALESIPAWVNDANPSMFDGKDAPAAAQATAPTLDTSKWAEFRLDALFELRKGKRLTKFNMRPGDVPYIGAIDKNNGVRQFISNREHLHDGGTITVNYNGSVGEAYYQPEPFWASDDVNVLYPRFPMTPATALFICTVIRQDQYRYNYGRKWHLERMEATTIKLPATKDGKPDIAYMEAFISTLPYSSQIDATPSPAPAQQKPSAD
mgnify:CR=1 FL=1